MHENLYRQEQYRHEYIVHSLYEYMKGSRSDTYHKLLDLYLAKFSDRQIWNLEDILSFIISFKNSMERSKLKLTIFEFCWLSLKAYLACLEEPSSRLLNLLLENYGLGFKLKPRPCSSQKTPSNLVAIKIVTISFQFHPSSLAATRLRWQNSVYLVDGSHTDVNAWGILAQSSSCLYVYTVLIRTFVGHSIWHNTVVTVENYWESLSTFYTNIYTYVSENIMNIFTYGNK